jgi:hypothetical protein
MELDNDCRIGTVPSAKYHPACRFTGYVAICAAHPRDCTRDVAACTYVMCMSCTRSVF